LLQRLEELARSYRLEQIREALRAGAPKPATSV
jgi:hypothetical protein